MNELNILDARTLSSDSRLKCDAVIVGSGPAGAAVAAVLASGGMKVIVIEEGSYYPPDTFHEDSYGAMKEMYREMGASLLRGKLPMPYVQGKAVGGTSVINGAISWRLPRDIYDQWVSTDPAAWERIPWLEVEEVFDEVYSRLGIHPTEEYIAGPNNLLLKKGADALNLENRPIARNVRQCEGLGRCLQGCPKGHKQSMDRTFLVDASAAGAQIIAAARVDEIQHDGKKVSGVGASSLSESPVRVQVQADRVILAASAVQTPALLLANGIRHPHTGYHFQCHPGVSMAGKFKEDVRMWSGATQGHEVIGLRKEGIKFEALGYGMALTASRLKPIGLEFAREVNELRHWANWGAAVKAEAHGRVRVSRLPGSDKPVVLFTPSKRDIEKIIRGIQVMGEMMLAAGAEYVTPGIPGWHAKVADPAVMSRLLEEAPRNPKAYTAAVTHMFGTCRMGSNPLVSVVKPDLEHHSVANLYVADSSWFPSNTGVNPQSSIIAFALLFARNLLQK